MRFLMDRKYEKEAIRRAMQTAEKLEHQMNSLPTDVHWLLTRITEGYPFAVKYHEEPFQGYVAEKTSKGAMTFISPPPNQVDRSIWPNVVDMACMTQDYLDWARMHNHKGVHNALSIHKLMTKIMGKSLQRHRVTINRNGAKDRPSVYSLPTAQEIVDGLIVLYPSLAGEIKQRVSEAPDVAIEDRKKPADKEREF
jgi:hypothetical protein